MVTETSSSSRFIWKIVNFSKLNEGLNSDVFTVGGSKWKATVYPKVNDHLSVFLYPAKNSTKFPYEANFSVAITSQTNCNNTVRFESKQTFDRKRGWGWGHDRVLRLSELYDSDKGYIVNDSCVIKFEVSCRMIKDSVDNDIKESHLVSESESNLQIKSVDGGGNSRAGEHPGQPFEEGRHNSKCGFCEGEEFEDIGGFSISKTHASLYKQIWAKYGHIPTTKVMPISSYSALVRVVKDLMSSIVAMHQCRFVELSTEMIDLWEEKIKMAEKLEFNVRWLRERFETVKRSVPGMQKIKTGLQEHGQPLRAAKSNMKAIGDMLKMAEAQLDAAKNYVRENVSGLLPESDMMHMEMYLEKGENLLFDGMFELPRC